MVRVLSNTSEVPKKKQKKQKKNHFGIVKSWSAKPLNEQSVSPNASSNIYTV